MCGILTRGQGLPRRRVRYYDRGRTGLDRTTSVGDAMKNSPRVTVGLPVYNGENFLEESLEALLAQTFDDFELIISDNASTDATPRICQAYAKHDARIRYVRQPRNLGGAPNQNLLTDLARGELFKLAAHDDLYGPELLERCVDALDAHPEAVLCHVGMAYIDASGDIIADYDYTMATGSRSPAERFRSLLFTDGGDDEYGVIRTSVLREVTPEGSFYNPGRPFVAELALHGPFEQVPEVLYFRRDHPGRGDRSPTVKALCTRLDPRREGHSTARLLAEYVGAYFRAVHRAPLSTRERLDCYFAVGQWLASRLDQRSRLVGTRNGRREWRLPTSSVSA